MFPGEANSGKSRPCQVQEEKAHYDNEQKCQNQREKQTYGVIEQPTIHQAFSVFIV
jgi:hypothetical protein